MANSSTMLRLFAFLFFTNGLLLAQNPNVIVKCSEVTPNYLLNDKNKVKVITCYEVSKNNTFKKRIKSKEWFSSNGCSIKKQEYINSSVLADYYIITNAEYNSIGYRTKFEQYGYTKDSKATLICSEYLVFDTSNRLQEKNTEQYLSKKNTKYISEKYLYDQPDYKMIITQRIFENDSFPNTINVFKYMDVTSQSADYKETTYYTSKNSYVKTIYEQDKSTEIVTIKNDKTVAHEKTVYESKSKGIINKETRTNLLSGKIMEETIHPNEYEWTVIKYDEKGNKVNEYTEHLPYGFPSPKRVTIEGEIYDAPVKSDTVQLKNGDKKITIYSSDYGNSSQYKLSQTLEYTGSMLLLQQNVEGAEAIREYEYEFY